MIACVLTETLLWEGANVITGLLFVLFGLAILFYPRILVIMISSLLILFGLGMMAASWQFRRLRTSSRSRFINWLIRY